MIVEKAAHILDYMQKHVVGDIPNVPKLDLAWYQSLLRDQCDSIIRSGHPAKEVDKWYSICEKMLVTSWDYEDTVFQHTDFYQENIITDGREFYLIDFANASFGSRYFDVSLLFISLENYKLYRNVNWKIVDMLKKELISHFDTSCDVFYVMNICQYLFAYKILLSNPSSHNRLRHKIFMRDLRSFYMDRINCLISCLS